MTFRETVRRLWKNPIIRILVILVAILISILLLLIFTVGFVAFVYLIIKLRQGKKNKVPKVPELHDNVRAWITPNVKERYLKNYTYCVGFLHIVYYKYAPDTKDELIQKLKLLFDAEDETTIKKMAQDIFTKYKKAK